jgi:hypothetical protein
VERRPALSVLRLVYTTTLGLKSTRLHKDPSAVSCLRVRALVSGLLFAVRGLRVQALVSGLLLTRIQLMRLPTDPGLQQATKDSSSGLLRDHVPLDPAYTATYGSTAVSGYSP